MRALLLTPDDDLIAVYEVPDMPGVTISQANPISLAAATSSSPAYRRVEFVAADSIESLAYSLLAGERVRVFRQEGWITCCSG